jgi:hypothetical protein
VRFSNDLSRAFIDVKIEGIDPATVNMFHIHCGKPGILGPILVDFAMATDLKSNLADGVLTVEITNEHIVKNVEHAHGLVGAFTAGCVIPSPSLSGLKPSKVSTVAGCCSSRSSASCTSICIPPRRPSTGISAGSCIRSASAERGD